jgi:hypothetical protein
VTARFARALATALVAIASLGAGGAARANASLTLPDSAAAMGPQIAIDPSGVAYVIATESGGTRMWRIDPSGARALNTAGLASSLPGGRAGAVAIDAAGYPHVAEMGTAQVTVRRSIDGGETWDRGTAAAAPYGRAVAMAAGRFNSVVEGATLTLASEDAQRIVVARSTDGGLTFTPRVATTPDACVPSGCALGGLATDATGDSIWLLFTDAGGYGVVARSGDGGASFTSASLPSFARPYEPRLALGPDGTAVASFFDGSEFRVVRSGDGLDWTTLAHWPVLAAGARVAAGPGGSVAVAFYERAGDGWRLRVARGTTQDGFGEIWTLDDVGIQQPFGPAGLAADPAGGFVAAYAGPEGLRAARF